MASLGHWYAPQAASPGRRCAWQALAAMAAAGAGAPVGAQNAIRFGTSPVFLNEQLRLLSRWQRYLEAGLEQPVRFVQRGSYREILDLLLSGSLEMAWLCGHPFVLHESALRPIAVPVYQGEPLYRSYLVVPLADRITQRVGDLKGRVFAYSDPLSNSGYLVPRAEIARSGGDPMSHFRRSFFTFSHRKVVEAVRSGLADGGSLDGYIWDTLALQQPSTLEGVRVAWRSGPYAFPPVVARASLGAVQRERIAEVLLGMQTAPEGRAILAQLNLDGFERSRTGQFESIRLLLRHA